MISGRRSASQRMTTKERIGFIGLGRMGRPMASNLCRKGFELVVLDVLSAPMSDVERLGARTAAAVAGVAFGATVVMTMLPDSSVVENVICGADGVLTHAARGTLIVEMSTIDPRVTDRIAVAAAE